MVIVESNESNVMCDIYFEQFQFFSLFITVVFIDMIVIFLSYSNNNVLVLVFLLLFFSKLKKKKKDQVMDQLVSLRKWVSRGEIIILGNNWGHFRERHEKAILGRSNELTSISQVKIRFQAYELEPQNFPCTTSWPNFIILFVRDIRNICFIGNFELYVFHLFHLPFNFIVHSNIIKM